MFGHVRWFIEENDLPHTASLSVTEILVALLFIATGIYIVWLINSHKTSTKFNKWCDKTLRPLRNWVPTILRLSLGTLLIVNAWQGNLFAPNLEVDTTFQEFLNWTMGGLGVLLISGIFVKSSGIALALIYVMSFVGTDTLLLLEHLEYPTLGLYLSIVGSGKFTLKEVKVLEPFDLSHLKGYALTLLRAGTGLSLVILGFSEKLLNLPAAQDFLNDHSWNLLSPLGVSDRWFIIIAGVTEIIVGLSLVFNLASRYMIFVVLVLFSLTAALLGFQEVVGHMFAIGVVLAIWVNYPKETRIKITRRKDGH